MMKPLLAGLALVCLAGCSSLPGADPTAQLPSQVLDNLSKCKRTYQASVGGLGIPGGSLYIECLPEPRDPPLP